MRVRLKVLGIIVAIGLIPLGGCDLLGPDGLGLVGDSDADGWIWETTSSTYAGSDDWDSAVGDELGDEYEVADWSDLEEYCDAGYDALDIMDEAGLSDYNADAFVTRDYEKTYSSSRYYFVARHDGDPPSSFMVHDDLDSEDVCLGSWDSTKKILAVKKSSDDGDGGSDWSDDSSDSSSFTGFSIGSLSDGDSTSTRTQSVSSHVPNPDSTSTTTFNGSVRVYVGTSYTTAEPAYSSFQSAWLISDHPISLNAGSNTIYVAVYDDSGSLYDTSQEWTITGSFDQYPYRIELTWDTDGNDVDLHLVRNDNWGSSSDHCYWSNKSASYTQLDYDDTDGYGPENITIEDAAAAGTYDIYVKYFSGSVSVNATVKVFEEGTLSNTYTHSFSSSDVNTTTSSYDSSRDWHVGSVAIY